MHRAIIIVLFAAALPAATAEGVQHVGESARRKRDEVLARESSVPFYPFDASLDAVLIHLPILKFHVGGAMDLASISVAGTTRGQADPLNTQLLWVEDQHGEVIYLQEEVCFAPATIVAHRWAAAPNRRPFTGVRRQCMAASLSLRTSRHPAGHSHLTVSTIAVTGSAPR